MLSRQLFCSACIFNAYLCTVDDDRECDGQWLVHVIVTKEEAIRGL